MNQEGLRCQLVNVRRTTAKIAFGGGVEENEENEEDGEGEDALIKDMNEMSTSRWRVISCL